MFETVAVTEVLWVAICTAAAVHNARVWRDIRRDICWIRSGVLPGRVTPGAMALFHNDRESAFDWCLSWSWLSVIGVIGMARPNPPMDLQGWLVVLCLFAGATWAWRRSVIRGRRRARIKAGIEETTRHE